MAGGPAPERILARGLANALAFAQLDEVDLRFNELKRLAESRRDKFVIQRSYAKGALNVMAFWLRFHEQLREEQVAYERLGYDLDFDVQQPLNHAFQTLQDIAARFPNDVAMQADLARGVVNALLYRLSQGEAPLDVLFEWERKLNLIVARFPTDPEIQLRRSKALVNTMRYAD